MKTTIKKKTNFVSVDNFKKIIENLGIEHEIFLLKDSNVTSVLSLNEYRDIFIAEIIPKAKLQIFVSKKYRQFVLVLEEPKRTYEETISVPNYIHKNGKKSILAHIDVYRTACPNSKFKILKSEKANPNFCNYKIEVTATRTINTFLIGYDENHLFISMLPQKVNSVTEAHEILRPKGLSKNAVRMGEYFFDPVTDQKLIEEIMDNQHEDIESHSVIYPEADVYSNIVFYHRDESYVFGKIDCENKRHKSIYLNSLHRVYKNTELENKSNTWD